MSRKRFRRKGLGVFAPVAILALLSGGSVAAASYTVTVESEWTFTLDEAATVYIYGNSNRSCSEPTADPYLWLYNSSGTLVTQNDDGNHNSTDQCVSSKIVANLSAGDYLIRAGYCCSQRTLGTNPSGYDYELVIQDYELTGSGTTTTTTTTTTPTTTTTSTTTTTTIPQTVGAPTNLSLTVDYTNGTVTADWDAPTDGTLSPERYAIGFGLNDEGNASPYAVATGNVGDENALNTEYTFNASYLEAVFNEAHGLFNVMIRSDNDTNAVYSSWTSVSSVTIRNMPDSVDSTTVSQVFGSGVEVSWTPSSDGFVDPSYFRVAYDDQPQSEEWFETNTTSSNSITIPYSAIPDGTWYLRVLACGSEGDCNAGSTIEVSVFDEEASWATSTTTSTTAPPTTTTTVSPSTTTTTTSTLPSQPLAPPAGSTTGSPQPVVTTPPPTTAAPTSTSSTTTSTTTTTTTTTLPPTTTTTTLAPTTTTSPPTTSTIPPTTSTTSVPSTTTTTTVGSTTSTTPTTTVVTTTTSPATTSSLPQTTITAAEIKVFEEAKPVISVEPIPENEVRAPVVAKTTPEKSAKASEAIQYIADDELAGEVFTVVASEEVTVEDVQELVSNDNFDEIPPEAKEAIAIALSDQPVEVKETFEEEVNVFEGGFDEYVPADSTVPVKTRRVLVVATTAAFVLPAPSSSRSKR